MTIQKSNTLDPVSPWTRWFFAGESGSGKTTAISTFPGELLIIEPGNESSSTTLRENGIEAEVWQVFTMDDMEKAIADLMTRYDDMLAGNEDAFPWQTVVIESLTHYADLVIEALTNGYREDMNQYKWGQLSFHIIGIHNRLVNLGAHLAYTSQVEFSEKDKKLVPMLQGRARVIIPAACDAVGLCDVTARNIKGKGNVVEYKTYFRTHRSFSARTRYNWVPQEIVNFDFTELYDSVFNDNNNEED